MASDSLSGIRLRPKSRPKPDQSRGPAHRGTSRNRFFFESQPFHWPYWLFFENQFWSIGREMRLGQPHFILWFQARSRSVFGACNARHEYDFNIWFYQWGNLNHECVCPGLPENQSMGVSHTCFLGYLIRWSKLASAKLWNWIRLVNAWLSLLLLLIPIQKRRGHFQEAPMYNEFVFLWRKPQDWTFNRRWWESDSRVTWVWAPFKIIISGFLPS